METYSFQPKPNIEWVGFCNSTGYGQAAATNALSLHRSGKFNVKLNCLHNNPDKSAFSKEDFAELSNLVKRPEIDNTVQVLQCIPQLFRRVTLKNKKIALACFETFDPPQEWANHYNRCDAIICPSEFNAEQFRKSGVTKPIFCIPHILNLNVWNDRAKPADKFSEFTFLFVGTWKKRKGWEAMLEAWMMEFGPSDNVRLLIKTDKTDKAQEDTKIAKINLGKKEIAPISFERSVFDESQMASLFKSADCVLFPTLGEGFGLPGLHAMSVRVPLIVTNFSGCKEYAQPENCTLLEPSGFMIHDSLDPIPQFSGKKWPRIKVSSIREAMRHVLSNYKEAQEKADKAYDFVQANFGYSNFVQKFENVMETVYRGGSSKTQSGIRICI